MTNIGKQSISHADLTNNEFDMFRKLVFEKSGISLGDSKKELVRTRLSTRLRKGGFKTYKEYYKHVQEDKTGTEIIDLLDSISTNLTSFFREIGHFNFLIKTIIPEMVERKRANNETEIRVWSAGCSSGEEPYSLAFTLMDQLETIQTWDVRILASDLATTVLEQAAKGIYKEEKIKNIPKNTLRKYFQKGANESAGLYKVQQDVKNLIHFRRFNLNRDVFPFKKKFDFIFCRNVMIYFDKNTQGKLVDKYYDVLAQEGYLLIGHSESLTGVKHRFKYVQPTIYQKL